MYATKTHIYIHAKYFHQFLIKSMILRKTRTIHVRRNKKCSFIRKKSARHAIFEIYQAQKFNESHESANDRNDGNHKILDDQNSSRTFRKQGSTRVMEC